MVRAAIDQDLAERWCMQVRWSQKVQDCSQSLRNIFWRSHAAKAKTSSGLLPCCCRAQGMLEPLRQSHRLAYHSLSPFLLHVFPLLHCPSPLEVLCPWQAARMSMCPRLSESKAKPGPSPYLTSIITIQRRSLITTDNLDPVLSQLNQFPFQMASQQCRERNAAKEELCH